MDAQTKKIMKDKERMAESLAILNGKYSELVGEWNLLKKGFRDVKHQKSAALSKCKSYRVVIHDLKEVVKTQKEINDELLDKVSDLEKKFAGARGKIETLETTNCKVVKKANDLYRENKYLLVETHRTKLLIESIKWYNRKRKLQEVWGKLSKMLEES